MPPLFTPLAPKKLQAIPQVAVPMRSHGKPTRMAVITMGSTNMDLGYDNLLGPNCQSITDKRAGVARWHLAAHLEEGKL